MKEEQSASCRNLERILWGVLCLILGGAILIFNHEYTNHPPNSDLRFIHKMNTTMYDCGDNCDFPTFEFEVDKISKNREAIQKMPMADFH